MFTKLQSEIFKAGDHLQNLCLRRRIILIRMSEKHGVRMCLGWFISEISKTNFDGI